jgi:hypothetical protein
VANDQGQAQGHLQPMRRELHEVSDVAIQAVSCFYCD